MKKIKLIIFLEILIIMLFIFVGCGGIDKKDDWQYSDFYLINEVYIGENIYNFISLVGWEGIYNEYSFKTRYPNLTNIISQYSNSHLHNEGETFFFITWGKPLEEMRYQDKYIAIDNSITRYIGFPVYKDVSTAPVIYIYCTNFLNIWDYGYGGSNILDDKYNLRDEIIVKNSDGKYESFIPPYDEFDIELQNSMQIMK